MGLFQTEKPKLVKVRIGPTLMIAASSPAFLTLMLAQDAPQSHANPAINGRKHIPMALPEITKPAPQQRRETGDYLVHALALRPAGLLANRFLELVHALLARPF